MSGRSGMSGKKEVVIATRVTEEEAAALDRLRGGTSTAAYLRLLIRAAVARNGV